MKTLVLEILGAIYLAQIAGIGVWVIIRIVSERRKRRAAFKAMWAYHDAQEKANATWPAEWLESEVDTFE